jgi:protein-L-isoaspartate O-methyltransferase
VKFFSLANSCETKLQIGILVIPVDESGKNHQIKRIVKKKEDDFFEEIIGRATFVPYIMGERMM